MRKHQHLFPIIDAVIEQAVEDVEEGGDKVACLHGCDHCCHLLVEISWEEANELVYWLEDQTPEKKEEIVQRVLSASTEAKELFSQNEGSKKFMEPCDDGSEIPDDTYDAYFYDKKRPCPFLESGSCVAYDSRPTPCRLHLVTSDPALCSADVVDSDEYDIQDRFEEMKEEAGPIITALEKDGRWGQMAIMVEAVLKERGLLSVETELDSSSNEDSSEPSLECAA